MNHPRDRAARRSAAAKALEKFAAKRINAKKRAIKTQLLDKETADDLEAAYMDI